MKQVPLQLGILSLLTGCAGSTSVPPPSSAQVEAVGCEAPIGWDAVIARDPQFVVFGETHGTREAPRMFGDIVCALSRDGERILVGVEHSSFYNAAFQQAWALPPSEFGAALLEAGWKGREDGVASEAMFAMVRHLHALKEDGHSIDIVAFDGARDEAQRARFAHLPGQGPHEAAQAENIADAAAGAPYDRVLVLVGTLHAQSEPIALGAREFTPMAGLLRTRGRVLTLKMTHSGGTSWNCILPANTKMAPGSRVTHDMLDCGAHPQGGGARKTEDGPFIALGSKARGDFDGEFHVGAVSASPPAAPLEE